MTNDIIDPSIEQMRPRLLTLPQLRERLSVTEPMNLLAFEAHEGVHFRVGEDWTGQAGVREGGDLVDAWIRLNSGGDEFRLTKDALLDFGAKAGIARKYAERLPYHLLEPELNWWFQGNSGWDGKKFRAYATSDTVGAVGSGSIVPFSNLSLLDAIETGIRARFDESATEILVDYKLSHSLALTHARLVLPGVLRVMNGPGVPDGDIWSWGIQWRNSQLGKVPTSVDGYVFRWRCTNGLTDTLVTSGTFNRRASGVDLDNVYDWARAAVDNVLGGLEGTLDGVQACARVPVEGDVSLVLDDLFRQHSVPKAQRGQVIRNMAEAGGDLTLYTVLNSITQVANDAALSAPVVDKMLSTGGHVAHGARCGECRRILPE